jgi:hypothetical protein
VDRRTKDGFFDAVRIRTRNDGLRQIDPSFLPLTLLTFVIEYTPIHSRFFDFAALADACPRLEDLRLSCVGLKMDIDLDAVLSRFANRSTCDLQNNDLCNNGSGIDFTKLPAELQAPKGLWVGGNPRLSGAIRLPPRVLLRVDFTGGTRLVRVAPW